MYDYSTLPFKIAQNQFTYLGIKVTRKHNCLFKVNFLYLLNNTEQHLAQWSPLSTSLVGRINSIKMYSLNFSLSSNKYRFLSPNLSLIL